MTGLFAGFSTLHLRTFLVASQPGKRASRMTREQLSQLLLDSMVADEVTFYERAARTTFSDITNIDQYANTVHRKLDERYGSYLPVYLPSLERRRHPLLRSTQTLVVTHPIAPTVEDVSQAVGESSGCSSWPQPIPDDVKHNCMLTFAHETNIKVAATCAVCGRRTFSRDLLFTDHWPCKSFDPRLLSLDILRITDPHILERPTHYFTYGDPCIDGLALHKDGIHVLDGTTSIDICGQCHRDLVRVPPRVPALSLANDNIRGFLPADLQDVTWLEERLCARYLSSAYIVRLYDLTAPGAVDERPRIMKGHACAFPLNTVSTAIKLPWAIVKQSPLISCIVIGPRQPRIKDLRNVFKIRREKVRSLLMFLREHSKGYPQFPLDENALAMLPEDDVPELIMRHVLHETHDDAASLFAQETAGLDKHPGLLDEMDDDMDNPRSFLEHHGLLDLNGMAIPHHSRMMSAVANATGTERPDLVIRHGTTFVQEYNNPELFPGMFPTLFPWGTGGFEMKRRTALSFQRQAKYLLDLTEPAFRRHWSFIFVVAYIKQRRAIHNGSRFMCRAQDFVQLSNMMQTLTPSLVKRISDHLQHGGSLNTLIGDERRIFALIKKCQVVSAHVPGSRAIMIRARADIRAYFGRERQVHAQQAATYVRDLGDTEQSHATVSMMSGQLVSTVISLFGRVRDLNGTDDNIHPNGNPEPIPTPRQGHAGYEDGDAAHNAEMEIDDPQPSGLHTEDDEEDDGFDDDDMLPLNTKGLAYQVDDYLHRGATLATLTFFQFVQYVKLDTPPKNRNKNHHDLAETHPNFPRYIHRYTPNHSHGIPRCITSRFPRSDGTKSHGDQYCAAMMAHFVPFSNTVALKNKTETWESAFQQITFSERAIATMSNWAALNECEDARDADQLLRRRREANHSGKLDQQVRMVGTEPVDDSMADVNVEALLHSRSDQSGETLKYVSVLDSNGWFQTATAAHGGVVTAPARALVPVVNRKVWKKEQDVLEAKARADLMVPTASTVIYQHARRNASTGETFSPNALLDELVRERNLTPSQRLAFCIAGRRFFDVMHGNSVEPLRMLMHGEAGTGKTVVVRLLRELMDRFGHGNAIKFLAPTGKAASAIGGQTQHSAFGLDVHRRGLTTDETQATRTANHAKRLQFLQKAFGTVRWLFFDEVSLTSCEVFTEIDQSLRIATQRLDEPFGGVNVIFAGDLCQLPPVGAAPLYTRTSRSSLSGDIRTKIELGRLSWLSINSVVEFTEQMRMKDTDMASALARLRLRQCTDADARLLNTNVLRLPPSVTNVDLKTKRDLVVLAATNQTVRSLNERKAASQASVQSQDLVISHAIDDTSAVLELSSRNALLNYNGRGDTKVGMGRLPLFVGMPIIYRGPNQSIPLGVTNGAFGRVVNWKMSTDRLGFTIPKVAIIRFDENASWQLSGLEPGCLPIYPCASSFSFSLAHGENSVHRISRQQLPLQPGFAMTVHSAQGITCHGGVVVDLCRGGFPAYVSASRATRRQDIHLIGEYKRLCQGEEKATATLIEGDTCTRVCRFFSVKTSRAPAALDPHESTSTAEAVARWVFAYILTTETTSPTADPPKSHSISTSSPPSAKRTRDGLSSFPSAGKKVVIEIQEPDVENPLDQRRMFARAHRLRRARSTTPVIQARLLCERDTTEQTFGRNAALSQVLGALIKTVYGAFFATLDCQTAGLIRSPSRRWSALYYDRSIPLSWTRKADTWITVSTFE
ncbi:hypothetical protein CF335_g4320 [Tilletia laevis]|nr:hypothetical protein CF335_g4320 [Tilletia laevis]